MSLHELLLQIVAPLATSLIVGLLLAARGRQHARGWSLAIAAGMIVGVLGQYGFEALWPKRAEHWLLWIALAGGVAGAVDVLPGCRWWVRWPMRIAVAALAMAVILDAHADNPWTSPRTLVYVVGVLIAWSALSAGGAHGGNDRPRPWIICLLACAVAGLQLTDASSMVLAKLTVSLAAVLLPMVLIAWWTHSWSGAAGGAGVVSLLFGALLCLGNTYALLSPDRALLAACALLPASPWFAGAGPWRMSGAARVLFAALLVGVPLLFSAIAYWEAQKDLLGY